MQRFDVALVRAANPGPLTLSGTNTWLIGRDPCFVVDPGPRLEEHIEAVLAEGLRRGRIGGLVATHKHGDHVDALDELMARAGSPPVAFRGVLGPLRSLRTPGHASDHVAWVAGGVAFSGDAVLGEGSVFVSPYPGALAAYLSALSELRALDLELICPGHGPPVPDPAAKIDEYIAHRLDRERRLLAALDAGARTPDALLDAAWTDVPTELRPAATITLAAHLDKLAGEGLLPAGVQRPVIPEQLRS